MATDPLLFDDFHGFKIFFFAPVVGQSGIASGHLDAAVPQQLL